MNSTEAGVESGATREPDPTLASLLDHSGVVSKHQELASNL